MISKNHMLVNSVLLLSAAGMLYKYKPQQFEQVRDVFLKDTFSPKQMVFVSSILFLSFLYGSIMPDADVRGSMASRILYIPMIGHRTWSHSIWPLLLLFGISYKFTYAYPFTIGYFLHLLMDSVSAAGICWFYPVTTYKTYSSGAFVARNHRIKLYYTGKLSENWFVWTITGICVAILMYGYRWEIIEKIKNYF